jgi:hypothetical protein
MPGARPAARSLSRTCPGWRFALGTALILAFAGTPARPALAQAIEASPEHTLKAAFLYNFSRFVAWPDTTWARPDDPFVFGIVGADLLATALEEAVRGRSVSEHPLVVRRVSGAAELAGCRVVFVGDTDRRMLARVIEAAGRHPVLTVGESRDFAKAGGMITFVLKGSTLGFEINHPAAELAGLRISSKLLKLATVASE